MGRMTVKQTVQRTNDETRELILKCLYDVNQFARSLKSARLGISELKRELKKHGLSEKEIVSNLSFLIQSGWINVEKETSEFRTPKGFVRKQEKEYFKISDKGITYFDGISKFQLFEKSLSGINITNVNGVTVVGDGNTVVNSEYIGLYRELSLLSDVVKKSDQLTDGDKLNYVAEIETIKSQIMKPEPDKSIIKQAWEKLKTLATISGIVSFFLQAEKLAGVLLHG